MSNRRVTRDLFFFIKTLFVLYGLALAVSWFVQFYFPVVEKPNLYQRETVLPGEGQDIPVSYLHLTHPQNHRTLLMLPDEFYGAEFLLPLAESLLSHTDVLIPIYPGSDVAGIAPGERADLVDDLVTHLSLNTVDVLGHGYGGLVAFSLLSEQERQHGGYQSLTLLSSYGPPELHLLGNHSFNRSLYAMLYPLVYAGKYLVPHMGRFNRQPLQPSVIQVFRNADQRNVRSQVENIDLPVLILHPAKYRYISVSTAEENHRIIPQSYLVVLPRTHQTIREQPEEWKDQVVWFTELAETDKLPGRADAHKERAELARQPFDADDIESFGGWALFMLFLFLFLFTLVSEDIACISGGLLVASEVIDFWFAVFGCFAGIAVADIATYWLGRWIGPPILSWIPFRWFIKPEDLKRAERKFEMNGMEIIFATRFLPGTRMPVYLAAGILRTRFPFFLGYFLLSICISTPLTVGLAMLIGQPVVRFFDIYQDYAVEIFLGIVVVIYMLYKVVIPLTTVRGRRKLLVKWNRLKERVFQK